MQTPLMPGVPWPTIMLGETIITDAEGAIVDRLAYADGEGWICADVRWGEPQPLDPVPQRFWMTTLPLSVQAIWHVANTHGRSKYLAMQALRRHPVAGRPGLRRRPPRRRSRARRAGRRELTAGRPARAPL